MSLRYPGLAFFVTIKRPGVSGFDPYAEMAVKIVRPSLIMALHFQVSSCIE